MTHPIYQMMIARASLLTCFIVISGCVHTQTPATIRVPIPTPCIKSSDLPKPPNIQPDAELAKLTDGRLITTIAAERLDLKRYHSEASAIITACTTP